MSMDQKNLFAHDGEIPPNGEGSSLGIEDIKTEPGVGSTSQSFSHETVDFTKMYRSESANTSADSNCSQSDNNSLNSQGARDMDPGTYTGHFGLDDTVYYEEFVGYNIEMDTGLPPLEEPHLPWTSYGSQFPHSLVPDLDVSATFYPMTQADVMSQYSMAPCELGESSISTVVDGYNQAAGVSPTSDRPFTCPHTECGNSFNRQADLQRHRTYVHKELNQADYWHCDYDTCDRKGQNAFGRKDHFRDHLREFHLEDLIKRGGRSHGSERRKKKAGKLLAEPRNTEEETTWCQGRDINLKWFRCNRCLCRASIGKQWTCDECKTKCETPRVNARRMKATAERAEKKQAETAGTAEAANASASMS